MSRDQYLFLVGYLMAIGGTLTFSNHKARPASWWSFIGMVESIVFEAAGYFLIIRSAFRMWMLA